MRYDIFISYASEDKEDFVDALAKALQEAGLEVWYDQFELKIGDSIRKKIDQGLARSRYGIVVLSKAFFQKNWPQSELNALESRQNEEGRKVILPIWHQIRVEEVKKYSPLLLGLYAARSSDGLDVVVQQIVKVCREDATAIDKEELQTEENLDLQIILPVRDIQKALDEGRLVIDPEPSPRMPASGKYCPYDTHAVDLRLYHEIVVPKGGSFCYDLMEPEGLSEVLAKRLNRVTIMKDQPYILKTGEFILGRTLERIELPMKKGMPYLAARIEGKPSRARLGLLVHFTAPTVHPGWSGPVTLEMINLGPAQILLRPEMPIARLIVEQVGFRR